MLERSNYTRRRFRPLKILFFATVFVAIVAVMSYIVMLLWNHILVDAVGVKPLTFWKALGLLALCKILFGGFGGRRSFRDRKRKKWKGKWDKKWNDKWMNMSEEEKARFKSKWKERCDRRGRDKI